MNQSKKMLQEFSNSEASIDDVYSAVCFDIVENVKSTRASIWYFSNLKDSIKSVCMYDKRTGDYSAGVTLYEDDFPEYFDAISKHSFIDAADAAHHPATRCFEEVYFNPNNISSLLDFVISVKDVKVAVLCCEHCDNIKHWSDADKEYLQQMATLLRLSFLAQQRMHT